MKNPFRKKPTRPQLIAHHKLAAEMCEALGLNPEDIAGFTLEVRTDCVPNLTVIHQAWDNTTQIFARTLTNYTLTPKENQ